MDFTNTNSAVRTGGEADWARIVGGASVGILDVSRGISVVGSGLASNGAATNAHFDSGNAGLGVCTVLTNSGQFDPSNDDNVGAIGGSSNAGDGTFDTVVLSFNQVVNLTNVLFRAEGHAPFTGSVNVNGVDVNVVGGSWMADLVRSVFNFQYLAVNFVGKNLPASTNEFYIEAATVSAVPVPAALPLLLAGFGGLGVMARRKRKAA